MLEPERLVDITPTAAARDHAASDTPPCRGADDDGGAGRRPDGGRAAAVRARGAAGGRLAAAAEHGDDRREPPAAHALPVLPRPDGGGVQQARRRGPAARPSPARRACTRSSAPASTASPCTPPTCASPLVALDAVVHLQGAGGQRTRPADRVLRRPGRAARHRDRPRGTASSITAVEIPLLPVGARSGYLKVRDRASYEFALTSAAVALRSRTGPSPRRGSASAASGRSRGGRARPRRS